MAEPEGLEELRALLAHLENAEAASLLSGIRTALAAGIVRKEAEARTTPEHRDARPRARGVPTRSKVEPSVREALLPREAYVVAVRLLLAALDPLFMIDETVPLMNELTGKTTALRWEADRLQGSELDGVTERLSIERVVEIPAVAPADLKILREQVVHLRKLCDELFPETA